MIRLLSAIIASWLIAPAAFSADWQAVDFFDLSGGLNNGFDSINLGGGEAQDLQNVIFTTGGAVRKRKGYSNINSSAISATADFTGLSFYKQADGDRWLVATVNDSTDAIYKMDYDAGGPDGTWDDITGSIGPTFAFDDSADFTVGQDTLIFDDGDGTTPPWKWTGSGDAALLGGSPGNASMVEYHKNHLFHAGSTTNPSRVTFSQFCTNATAPGCIENYTATDIIDVETNDGQIIRAIKSALDALYIFKDRSIWRLSGNERDTFRLEQMVSGFGTLANNSVVIINNQFVFTTADCDVAVYDGGLRVEIISTKIEGTIDNLNFSRCDNAIAVAFDDGSGDKDYYLAISGPASSENNVILIYDTFHQAWTKFSGINANAMTTYEISNLQQAIAFGDYSGKAHRYPNTEADAGSAIDAYWISGDLPVREVPFQKTYHQAQLVVEQSGNYTIDFTSTIDFTAASTSSISLSSSTALWDSAVFGVDSYGDSSTTVGLIDIGQTGDFFRWKVENDSASEPFTVKGMRLWIESTGRVGTF